MTPPSGNAVLAGAAAMGETMPLTGPGEGTAANQAADGLCNPASARAPCAWKSELSRAFRHPRELLCHLGLDAPDLLAPRTVMAGFPMLVPRGFAALMQPGDPHDPLLRQVLPRAAERLPSPGYCRDPVNDGAACRKPGLLQKYAGRALLLVTGACAVHCRYCFRRYSPYRQPMKGPVPRQRFDTAIDAIAAAPDLDEVILSGGDPLLLDDEALAELVGRLQRIQHLRRLRIHTRLPVVLPSRVTPELCRLLSAGPLQPVLVVHVNHAAELGTAAECALARLAAAGIPLLNQSVLLRGINDDVGVLAKLAERLFELHVTNYYLHQLDRVTGVAHFEVSDAEAIRLVTALRAHLPGYLIPRLVREISGQPSKTPLG